MKYEMINLSDFSYDNAERIKNLKEFQRKYGYSIIPVSYFEPIPDLREVNLDNMDDRIIINKNFSFKYDLSWLKDSKNDLIKIMEQKLPEYLKNNPMLMYMDMLAYARFIEENKPKKIIEIGSGYSACLAKFIVEFLNIDTEIYCIEPAPNCYLESLQKEERVTLSKKMVQNIDEKEYNMISDLNENDILFIDTSHISVLDSDTNFIFFNILPLVGKNVNVHIHDIYLPYDYEKLTYYTVGRFYTEQYLLAAIMANSDTFSPLFGSYYHWAKGESNLKGSSFWMRKN